jgi:hypothetical protein
MDIKPSGHVIWPVQKIKNFNISGAFNPDEHYMIRVLDRFPHVP